MRPSKQALNQVIMILTILHINSISGEYRRGALSTILWKTVQPNEYGICKNMADSEKADRVHGFLRHCFVMLVAAAVILSLLLVLSGDVEENPGPQGR